MQPVPEAIGRAKAILVFGQGEAAQAVVTSVVVQLRRRRDRKRLAFTGSVRFEKRVIRHVNRAVLPVVDGIMHKLGLRKQNFDISIVNIGAVSAAGLDLTVSGFSADTPVFCAMLSAALKMPVRQDVVSTGQIDSFAGDIRLVYGIPAKLAAAANDSLIHRFVYPSIDDDHSLEALSPTARQRIADAITSSDDGLKVIGVSDVGGLLRAMVTEGACALAALRSGYFRDDEAFDEGCCAVDDVVRLLRGGNDYRLWALLEDHLVAGRNQAGKRLLNAWVRHYVQHKTYPRDFGLKLMQLLGSLPLVTRRIKAMFPLLPVGRCVQLAQFATEADHADVQYLFSAINGANIARSKPLARATNTQADSSHADAAVEALLAEISTENLANKIGIPIDTARAEHALRNAIVESADKFHDCTSAFYVRLLRHVAPVAPAAANAEEVAGEALALLERAFAGRGGAAGALAEARYGTNGGMRTVLDKMTDQFKTEQQAKYVNRILKEALNPLDWDARVAFMAAFLQRISPHLSDETRAAPPERFASKCDVIVHTYVRSLDRVGQVLRSL